ncbi:Fucoxanthin-chlorophyll a-c binding protein [Seminavis robusta]|uniref:Fucoxanthin-chlorophyll a-c binding protein n=1 Tax=Seminavis robusta TaxID=568900 RepID=A0A9N8HTM9_9STRA|nr:Fucoxanthin-chlorophyll a-c binding protein [Seminavis robusta]|eukprot:Sro1292_g260030.1 Fucoxanthin-chlorophyll a-c binding protein (209) ;mRNA; f:19617-20363
MKIAILASLLATASAFVPSSTVSRSDVATSMSFEDQLGAQPPLGFFDPLGLLSDADEEKFNRLRYTEIKHGRICMLAIVGHMVTASGSRLAGDIDYSGTAFSDIPAGLAAFDKIPAAGVLQVIAFIGFLELSVMKDITGGEFVGDFRNGFIDFGWDLLTPEEQERKRGIELNNGRAAQMGILALMVHEKLDGNPYIINDLVGKPVDFN